MVKDNRQGRVDNICVLRRRTARNAVTRPTTEHSEGGKSADKHGTDRRHGIITKQVQPIHCMFITLEDWEVLYSSILSQPWV